MYAIRSYYVTIFVIGHTISLAFAMYDVISVNQKWIAFLIPVTILIIALFNVFTAGRRTQNEKIGLLFFVTLFFGLVHGFGFVHVFESTIGSSENKVLALLEISLGFEIGQLIIAFVILFLGFLCQTLRITSYNVCYTKLLRCKCAYRLTRHPWSKQYKSFHFLHHGCLP